jgi:uncharacterized lipoprotein YddW (UPF0748 family)
MKLKVFIWGIILSTCFIQTKAQQSNKLTEQNPPKREFRGVWIATVENIDWPAKPGEPSDKQQNELLSLLDAHQNEGINAVIFQVRPAADAFYAKSLEPWSKWLNGQQGKAPDPLYDPLALAITEAHKRGMELHAWFNPYRATKDLKLAALSPQHITNIHPEWFFTYGGMKLFDPGIPEVRDYIVKVILNVVDNYDVDGIHMDDYFYPYPEKGQKIDDPQTFIKYGNNFTDISEWRRNNVDLLIKMLSDSIHRHNPRIKFGISPFSIWANKYQNPEGSETHGSNAYYQLYADSRKWIKEGWLDYIAPQLYRPLNDPLVAFGTMVDWWSNNTYNRHLYIGQAPYRIIENKMAAFKIPAEVPNEISYLRKNLRVQGSIFFSSNSLIHNPLGFTDSLKRNYYRYAALPPQMLWLDSIPPNSPQQFAGKPAVNGVVLTWQTPLPAKDNESVYGYVIYRFDENEKVNIDNPQYILHIQYTAETNYVDTTAKPGKSYLYVLTAIDRLKNESERSPTILVKFNSQ